MNEIITIISIMITFISIVVSIIFGLINAKMKKDAKTIRWSDLPHIANFVCEKCNKTDFRPDIIFTSDVGCCYLAKEISSKLPGNPIILNGILIKKRRNENIIPELLRNEYFIILNSNTWHMLLPKSIFKYKDKRILFVSEWVVTGGLIKLIKDYMQNEHIPEENCKSFAIATTKLAKEYGLSPDFYWKEISPGDDLFLPWGKAIH
jgi:hypoxanthine phosphoribosyltransferase